MDIASTLRNIQDNIDHTAALYNRNPLSIQLLAVSKGQSLEAIRAAYLAGLRHFGESYWQEARLKIQALYNLPIHWHYIGALQSNKAEVIAQHFSWVQSVHSEKIASLLSKFRPEHLPALNVCIQVNLDSEPNKSGIPPEEVLALARYVNTLPKLKLRGLMAIPSPEASEACQLQSFLRLTHLLQSCHQIQGLAMDTLSMGMSDDWRMAIAAGSTMLRIGRAIFGERDMIAHDVGKN